VSDLRAVGTGAAGATPAHTGTDCAGTDCADLAPLATAQWPGSQRATATRVRFQAPELPPLAAIGEYYATSEDERWFSNGGPNAQLLERRIEAYVGRGCHAVTVGNATLGLIVALRALAGAPGPVRRYVVVPSFTFVATVDAIAWCGFEPLFCDVSAQSWHADPTSVAVALDRWRGQVAAVLVCSTFGTAPQPHETEAWASLAAFAGVPLLVDSAAGFGSVDVEGRRLGLQGDVEVFSFHATKPFAIGEGGVVTTGSAEVAQACARLANFGFDHQRRVGADIGLNAKMSELHAATGLAALDRHGDVLAARRERAARLLEGVRPHGYVGQVGAPGSTFQYVPVLAPTPAVRDAALAEGQARGVELRTYYETPLHRLEPFARAPRSGPLTTTDRLASRALSLPMANSLSDEAIDAVIDCCAHASRSAGARNVA
jgi:dTDP-4-amino-4,6-dideoxygalactose transaminase